MEENIPFRSNASGTEAQVITRKYVFAPVSHNVKLVIFTVMLSFGLYGFTANSLILYFKQKQHRKRRHTIHRAYGRSVTEYFINSLALSDVLSSLISLPLFAAEMFIDFGHNDWICKINRFLNMVFPVITIHNLLVIGVERYAANFHPLFKPSRSKAKKIVFGAWVLGTFMTMVPIPTYKLIHYNIGENRYTLVCKYDNSKVVYQGLFIGFTFVTYIVPSFLLVLVNVRILKHIRRYKNIEIRFNFGRLKATQMFVSIIFAFVIPYSSFFLYNGVIVILKPAISLTADYFTRYACALLSLAHGAISATILFSKEKDLRKMFFDLFSHVFPPTRGAEEVNQQSQTREGNEQTQSENNNPRRQADGPAVITTKL